MLVEALDAGMLFPRAFEVWMAQWKLEVPAGRRDVTFLAARTEKDYRTSARALMKYFCRLRLADIPPRLVEYQRARAANLEDERGAIRLVRGAGVHGPFATREAAAAWAKAHGGGYTLTQTLWARPAGATVIRKEVDLVLRILRAAKLWGETDDRELPRIRRKTMEIPRAMTLEEQHRFLHVASGRLEYRLIYQYAIVALQTTAATNEMRWLRLGDVVLANRIVQIPRAGAKNPYRVRTIPLVTEDAIWAMGGLLDRARELGSIEPTHYLFPFRARRNGWDVTRPMSESGLKKQWERVRRAAQLPALRIYDLRHTGITRMAEAGVPLAVAMSFAGHMTEEMQRHYTAVCMASQRGWGEQVWGTAPGIRDQGSGMRRPVASDHGMVPWISAGRA